MFQKLARAFIIIAILCILYAVYIKAKTVGHILPGSLPLNWAKLADTFLLFSIAVSLVFRK